jgi:hypothetical protein
MTISTKKLALICLLFVSAHFAKAQVKVGDNPTVINKGSILELESTDKGLLFPRVALTNTTTWSLVTGSTPVAGMVVYNTKKLADGFLGTGTYPTSLPDGTGLYYWDGTGWVAAKGLANETITTLTKGLGADAGKYTYKNELGALVDIKIPQTGTGVPPVGSGSPGDIYVNTVTGDVYTYNSTTNTWEKMPETLTTLKQGLGADAGKFTYKNEIGDLVDIKVTQSGAGAPTTITNPGTAGDVYVNTTTGDVYTYNGTTWVKANEVITTLTQGTGANAGKFTYLNEAGTPVDIKVTQSGVVAPTAVANPGTAGDVYVNSATGEVYVYNGVTNTWVKAVETLTTLTQGTGANAGKFTYLNEAGTPVDIKVTQSGVGVPPAGTGTAGDVYVNTTNGDVYTYNGTTWVKANEVITTLTQGTGANAGKFTYLNEAGTPVDIKVTQSGVVAPTAVANPGTAGDVYVNSATGEVYVYNGVTNTWVKAGETLTTLTKGTGADSGKFTYLNEAGTPVDIKVTQSGVGVPPAGTGTAGDVYVNTTNGDVYTYNGTTWVKANEVITTLTQGTGANAGKFTYLNEAGTPVDIKVTQSGVVAPTAVANPGTAGDVYVNSATGEVYVYNGVTNTWVKAGETLTTLTKGTGADSGKFTYLNEAGTPVDIKVTQSGVGVPPAGTGTVGDVYVNTTNGDVYTYNGTTWVKANEVITTLTQGTGANAGKFTYLNEAGTPVDIKVTQSGAGAPAAGTGSPGDVYINTTNGDVYTYNSTNNAWEKPAPVAAIEPWQIQANASGAKGTLNTDHIYQQGKVAVGFVAADALSTKQFEVKGDLKSLAQDADGNYHTIESKGSINGSPSTVIGVSSTSDLSALTATTKLNAISVGANQADLLTLDAAAGLLSNVQTNFNNVLLNHTSPTGLATVDVKDKTIDLKAANIAGQQSTVNLTHDNGVQFLFNNAAGTAEGAYTFPRNNGTVNQVLTTDGGAGNAQLVWKNAASVLGTTTVSNTFTPTATTNNLITTVNGVAATAVDLTPLKIEPWQVQGSAVKGTLNTDHLYQQGKVAVGFTSADALSTKQMEVKGDFKSETTIGTNTMGLEVNTPYGSETTGAYWKSNTNQFHALVVDPNSARAVATNALVGATKTSNFEVTLDAVNMYSKHPNNAKQGTLELNGLDGRFSLYANQYAANWGSMVKSDAANGLLLYHAGSSATTAVVDDNDRTQITIKKADGVTFQHHNAAGALTSSYKFPLTTGTTGQVMTQTATGRIIWSTPAATATEPWKVIGSGASATSNTENIYQMGNIAIGAVTAPSFLVGATTIQPKLHVEGDIATTGKIYTTNSVYADYVFDYYFDGFSKIYDQYKFKSLTEVAAFIKANKHLPGVTPIKDIMKTDKGYTLDLTQLSMQQLEKLEELYLHVIEMNTKMTEKDKQIKTLQERTKSLEERLSKLEQLIDKK